MPDMKIETGWVIELGTTSPSAPLYLAKPTCGSFWSVDDLKAIRFARKADAFAFMEYVALERSVAFVNVRVTEHQWDPTPPPLAWKADVCDPGESSWGRWSAGSRRFAGARHMIFAQKDGTFAAQPCGSYARCFKTLTGATRFCQASEDGVHVSFEEADAMDGGPRA